MATIFAIDRRISALNIAEVAVQSIEETSDARVTLNRGQLAAGKNALGDVVGYYSSRQYAAYKQALGSLAPYGIVDLKLTRKFYDGIKSDVGGLSINYYSSDSKNAILQGKYGPEILGLNSDSRVRYVSSDLRPAFNSKIEQKTGLKFK